MPRIQWATKIALRDGVELNATVYLPDTGSAARPCVFTLTPYVSDTYHERGMYFAGHGYPFLIVDVRGRGNSGGTFRPRIQEAKDGHDVVEWIAKQPYCNGKVAMWGGSYAGYDQWVTAKEFPPHLATIVPVASPLYSVEVPMRNNVFAPYMVQWLMFTAGKTVQSQIYGDRAHWAAIFRRWHESGRSFRELDAMAGMPSPVFHEYLDHPEPDDYWAAYNPSDAQYARMDMPILTITGSYDDDQPGAIEHYRRHMRHATDSARRKHFLVIGPWDHAGTRTPLRHFGGVSIGEAGLVDLPKLHLEWYAWAMEEGPRPAFLEKPVAYYVMGAERWRHADSLEAVTASHACYFLDSSGRANDVFESGSLSPQVSRGPADRYTYDPRVTSGSEVEAEERVLHSLTGQGVAMALSGRQFVYHSAPFERDTEVSGFFRLKAWLAIDTPDTDFYVSVHDIAPDGSSLRLTTDAIRARYREGLTRQRLIETREPLEYDFNRFTFISRTLRRGHRLRLIIAPVGRLIDAAFTQKNYNGGGVVAEETAADGRPVTVTLVHDESHPSALYVPLGQPE
jgi:putative CocE/NonD family hydrolase